MTELWTPKEGEMPYIFGQTDWEYVKRPKGIRNLFRRPKIRYTYGFIYYHRGKYEIHVPRGSISDAHSIPWVFVVANLGLIFHYVMQHITWPSGVHDEACKRQLYTREMRADIYHESIWLAGLDLQLKIEDSDDPWWKRQSLMVLARVRNFLLVAVVKGASRFGGVC
jgi:hypothetical protein